MFIQTEQTPNPITLKFVPGCEVMSEGTADFTDKKGAANSPLAKRLFAVEGVRAVFFGSNFVTVTKSNDVEWAVIKAEILQAITEHFESSDPVISDGSGGEVTPDDTETKQDSAVVKRVKELLDNRVRPAVAMDGGDITFRAYEDGIVYLKMRGACSGCPSSTATLKAGIENLLRHYIPEVQEVRTVL